MLPTGSGRLSERAVMGDDIEYLGQFSLTTINTKSVVYQRIEPAPLDPARLAAAERLLAEMPLDRVPPRAALPAGSRPDRAECRFCRPRARSQRPSEGDGGRHGGCDHPGARGHRLGWHRKNVARGRVRPSLRQGDGSARNLESRGSFFSALAFRNRTSGHSWTPVGRTQPLQPLFVVAQHENAAVFVTSGVTLRSAHFAAHFCVAHARR